MWKYCFGVLGHSLAVAEDREETAAPDRIPADPGVEWGWGPFSGQNPRGQRPQEARAVGELGPLQSRFWRQVPSSDPLTAAAAAVGRRTLRTADWGRFFAPQVSRPVGYRELLTTMKGGAPGKGLALTPRSPAPHLPPQAAAWDPPGTPRSRRFPHGLARGLQPPWPAAPVPPAPDSSIMGSQKPETAEATAPRGPLTLGKGLSAGPSRGAGRCHGCPYGPPGAPRGDLHPTTPQQPLGFCSPPAACLATPRGYVVIAGQACLSTALMPRALEPHQPAFSHPEGSIKDNLWPGRRPFTRGGPGTPVYSGGDARRHCRSQTPS